MEEAWVWALVDHMEAWVWVVLAVRMEEWVVMEALVAVLVVDMEVDLVDAMGALEDMVA